MKVIKTIAFSESHLEDLEKLREEFKAESFSRTVRLCVEQAAKTLERKKKRRKPTK